MASAGSVTLDVRVVGGEALERLLVAVSAVLQRLDEDFKVCNFHSEAIELREASQALAERAATR